MRRWMLAAVLLLTGCGVGGVSSTSTPDPVNVTQTAVADCRSAAVAYQDEAEPIVSEWDDAMKLVEQTPRMQLAEQINNLQEIKRKADAVKVPECAKDAHPHLIASMEASIDGLIAFMGQKSDATVYKHIETASDEMSLYELELVKATRPVPTETPVTTP